MHSVGGWRGRCEVTECSVKKCNSDVEYSHPPFTPLLFLLLLLLSWWRRDKNENEWVLAVWQTSWQPEHFGSNLTWWHLSDKTENLKDATVRLVEEIIQLRTSKLAGGEGLCNGRNTADWIKPKMQATRLIERSTISDDKKKEVPSSYTVYQCSYIRVMIIGNVLWHTKGPTCLLCQIWLYPLSLLIFPDPLKIHS